MNNKLRTFMIGRYGIDDLYKVLLVIYTILILINIFIRSKIIAVIEVLLIIIMTGFAIDVAVTVSTIVKFNRRLKVMDDIAAKIKVLSNQIGENIYENVEEALEKSAEFKEEHAEKIEKLENLRHKYDELLSKKNAVSSRLMKAFPDMKSKHHNEILQKLKKINIRK
mgnify:CR=1 FL=1